MVYQYHLSLNTIINALQVLNIYPLPPRSIIMGRENIVLTLSEILRGDC